MRSSTPCWSVGSLSPNRTPSSTGAREPTKMLPPSTYPYWRAGADPREMGNPTNWPGSSVFSSTTCRSGWMRCGKRSRGERPKRWRRRPTCSKAAPVTWEQAKWRRSAPASRDSAPPVNCRAPPSCWTSSKRSSNASAPPWKPQSRRIELVDGVSTGAKSLSSLTVALVLFGLAGSAVMVAVPGLFAGPVRPEFTVFLVAGVAAIVLTAGFFGYIYRLGMGFGRTVLVLAAGYNALIAVVKLGLAPAALYQANREQAFDAAFGDPNELWFYLGVGSGILLLYLLVFGVMYSVFRRRFRRRSLPSEPPPEQRGRWSNRTIVVGVVVLVAFAASFLWIMPVVYVGLPTFSYLFYISSTFGAAITLALILAAVLAYRSFDEVEKRAVRLGDATLLASFFWLGLALILLYHVMWVVFLLKLVSIWPFRTYTPK